MLHNISVHMMFSCSIHSHKDVVNSRSEHIYCKGLVEVLIPGCKLLKLEQHCSCWHNKLLICCSKVSMYCLFWTQINCWHIASPVGDNRGCDDVEHIMWLVYLQYNIPILWEYRYYPPLLICHFNHPVFLRSCKTHILQVIQLMKAKKWKSDKECFSFVYIELTEAILPLWVFRWHMHWQWAALLGSEGPKGLQIL